MANVDPNELGKFDECSPYWWDVNSEEFKTLHDINPLRLDWIDKNAHLDKKKVVDVGCGGGLLTEGMAKRGAKVTGIDLSEKALQVARLHLLESDLKIDYQQACAEDFAIQNAEQFDIVTCLELLEHIPDPASTVRACAALVKPGGQVFFSTLNRNPKAYLLAVIAAEYLLRMLPRGTHDYARFIKPSELRLFCYHAKLEIEEIIGLHYSPLTKRYHLGGNTDVNYFLRARRQ